MQSRHPATSKETRPAPSDEEIIQHNVAYVLANRNTFYDHPRGRLDAVGVIEVAISERFEAIKHYRPVSGRRLSTCSRAFVAKLRYEAALMEEALCRLRALGVTTNCPLAKQLRRERENPRPSVKQLLAPAVILHSSEKLRKQAAVLFDTEKLIPGVDAGKIRPELIKIAVVTKSGNGPLNVALTAGWGHVGQNGVTMPGKGKLETGGYAAEENGSPLLGQSTHDVFLNESACWRNVPELHHWRVSGHEEVAVVSRA